MKACSPDATPEHRDAYSARIALCFNAYYNIYVDNATLHVMQVWVYVLRSFQTAVLVYSGVFYSYAMY